MPKNTSTVEKTAEVKEVKSGGGRKIILETGEARADAIRRLYGEGQTRRQIANRFGIRYQQVFQLTSSEEAQANRPHCSTCTCQTAEAVTEPVGEVPVE